MACNAANTGDVAQFGNVLRGVLQVVFSEHQHGRCTTIERQDEFAFDASLI